MFKFVLKKPRFVRTTSCRAVSCRICEIEHVSRRCGMGNFIGIHFRFNTGDFFGADFAEKAEDEATGNHIPNQIAKHIHRSMLNGTYFLDKVVNYIETKVENGEFVKKPTAILVTSPTYNSIAEQLKGIHEHRGYVIASTLDSTEFLKRYEACVAIRDLFGDFLSTLEKEILLYSSAFFRARPSNWSFNIQGRRFSQFDYERIKNDRVVFDLFSNEKGNGYLT